MRNKKTKRLTEKEPKGEEGIIYGTSPVPL